MSWWEFNCVARGHVDFHSTAKSEEVAAPAPEHPTMDQLEEAIRLYGG